MNLEISTAQLLTIVGTYLWPFIRIGAFVMVMPLIGSSFVPVRVRLLIAVALTIVMAPVLPTMPTTEFLSLAGMLMTVQEIAIGIAMGFLVQLVFDAITLGGQVIAMSMGLGFAVFLDRTRGVNIPVLGQLFLMLGMLIFLSLDGHLALIRLVADSFQLLPAGSGGPSLTAVSALLEWSGQVFVVAVKIALPAITALIVVNLSFGVMSRAAPTLNLFAVGFPVAMLLGFVVIFLNLESLQENVSLFLEETLTMLPRWLGS
ncbi:MAG: flagellar biosynthetic protein FliR [Gammaproteobacteria bacterium]|nr:flagellar biosynthetic protein FliR [Gammaproteobacteria bacterium]MDH4313270.1 flagellar biosynthetic protein FliR [Gammaproteobacteria bacterium]MDH5212929.1 flagellar biosynthetic protein FliR [Gammaproteobacteria bacterium]MDH5499464.1 flagellar biosynthetic protein FliR [Gammaproteobacteria bacterium]